MILHPPVLALLLGSLLTCFMLLYASWYGAAILRRWDLQSGSELQLGLERKTYLISTLVSYAFGFQLLSLFLFIYTADDLCPLFVGAMCAAGTLNVNSFGYPTLALKIVNFLLAGTWLILNHVDNKAYDYPLIRKKYLFLLLITPIMLAETVMQFRYFHGLLPDIITSCCGTLFSAGPREEGSAMSFLSNLPMGPIFFIGMVATIATGLVVYAKAGKGSLLFGLMSAGVLVLSLMALISVFSLYVYELPSHHCPFCLLQREYRYIGYPLYLSLFGGTVAGLGAGVVAPFKRIESLSRSIPPFQQKLVMTSLVCYGIFTLIIIWETVFSNLKLA